MSDDNIIEQRTGRLLLPLGLYLIAVVVMYIVTLPPTVTEDFGGDASRGCSR